MEEDPELEEFMDESKGLLKPDDLTNRQSFGANVDSDALTAGFYTKFVRGVTIGISAFKTVAMNPGLREEMKAVKKILWIGFFSSVLVALTVWLLFNIPFRVFSIFFPAMAQAVEVTNFTNVFFQLSVVITLITTDIMSMMGKTTSQVFFATLRVYAPELEAKLKPTKVVLKLSVMVRVKRYARLLLCVAALKFFSQLPVVGMFAAPIQVYLILSPKIGTRVATYVALLAIIPNLRPLSSGLMQAWLGAMGLSYDLCWEYVARLPTSEMRRYFVQRYQGALTGLGMVYASLMTIPLLGIGFFILAQGAGALLLIDILKSNPTRKNKVDLLYEDTVRSK